MSDLTLFVTIAFLFGMYCGLGLACLINALQDWHTRRSFNRTIRRMIQ